MRLTSRRRASGKICANACTSLTPKCLRQVRLTLTLSAGRSAATHRCENIATGIFIIRDEDLDDYRVQLYKFSDTSIVGQWSFKGDVVDVADGILRRNDAAIGAWDSLPAELRDIIALCLTADPATRPSAQQLQQDPNTRILKQINSFRPTVLHPHMAL